MFSYKLQAFGFQLPPNPISTALECLPPSAVRTPTALLKLPTGPCAESARPPSPPACSWAQQMEDSVGDERARGERAGKLLLPSSVMARELRPSGDTAPPFQGSRSPGLWKYRFLPLLALMIATSCLTTGLCPLALRTPWERGPSLHSLQSLS